ncbi:alpha/beta fold hydrolase (plasmid) [Streptomyces anulatus]|uniref:thioesterase II family protein n=1 Tax=Streptomyces TaxID=1883 RepID=UPI0016750D8F|nr:alpha/beta fold hydrolase [Streptomyces anulatus]WSC66777.1 alpha/beta fold hydrolase [Streptomyces anulatus]GGY73445.1 thioesterase [Streptomyces anulatus]
MNGPADGLAVRPDRWIVRPAVPRKNDRDLRTGPLLRLVCVPYAGGGASVYQRWGHALLPAVEPWALRLPGHDARMAEPLATDLVSVAADAAAALVALGPGPYALFGHSLGAFLAFEIARALRDRWDTEPTFLAVGGRNAPHLGASGVAMSHLPDDEYLDLLDQRFGAIPKVIREDAQMRDLYLPILRADVTMLETYAHRPGRPLSCPILALGGEDDPETSVGSLAAWGAHTTAGCTTVMLPGGHFFLETQREQLLQLLSAELLATLVP